MELQFPHPGHYEFEGLFRRRAGRSPHKGGRTFGYRVSDGTATVAYMSDHSPISLGPGPDGLGEYHEAAVELTRGADLLVHDSQHTAAELPRLAFLGHSAIEYVVGLAQYAQVKAVALYHHDPWRTDDEIDELAAKQASGAPARKASAAFDGLIVDLPS